MLVRKGFRYRIYPTEEQAERLARWDGTLRFLWNVANEQRLHAYGRCKADRKYPTAFDQINELTQVREEVDWIADVPRDVCAQLLVELDKGWQRCFKGLARAPRWKRKWRSTVPMIEPHAKAFRLEVGAVVFPKIGRIRAVVHRPIEGTAKTCAIVREVDQWFVSISCEVEIQDPVPNTKPAVGIDRGVVNIIADSDGRIVKNPLDPEKHWKRMARAQRIVARRKKGSKNQGKARLRVAKTHRKARRQREAVLHSESLHYAKNHGVVVVERLNIRNMTRSAKGTVEDPGTNVSAKAGLNRAVLGVSLGALVRLLAYKLLWHGGVLAQVWAAYSSQECSECGVIDERSRRSQSEFHCVACGHHEHADTNAAKVLKLRWLRALAVEPTATGCGGSATGRPAKQQLRVVRRGTRSGRVGSHSASPLKAPAFRPG